MDTYKIIIADDEEVECNALELMIRGSGLGLQVLKSVHNGIELLEAVDKEQPDIAIVDINMPGLKGLDAVELIRMKNERLKIVMNTAYSDFSYIKRAMQYNVVDYVLKPVRRPELYEVLKKIQNQLDTERKIIQENLEADRIKKELTELSKERIMAELLLGTANAEDFLLFQHSISVCYLGGSIIAVREIPSGMEKGQSTPNIMEIFERELSRGTEYLCKRHGGVWYYLVIPGTEHSIFREWLKSIAQNLFELSAETQTVLRITVSDWKTDAAGFVEGIQECRTLQSMHTDAGIFFYQKRKIRLGRYRPELMTLSENCEKLTEQLAAALQRAKCAAVVFEEFKISVVVFLIRLLYENTEAISLTGGLSGWIQFGRWKDWMACRDYDELQQRIDQMQKAGFLTEPEAEGYMQITIAAMKQSYYRQELSLDELAGQLNITPFYLSRLFRQELNMNFTEVLTDIRMGQALRFLYEEDCSAREISERTGFASLNYFYKVFKKYYGITFGELREHTDVE